MFENQVLSEFKRAPTFKELEAEIFPARRKKILVVDDDQDFRLTICELLVDEGFSVTTAKDGDVAFSSLCEQEDLPDLILLDLYMPVKSGFEFRRDQLSEESLRKIPVMFLTGQGYVEGESCLLKPIDEREFIQKVKNHIGVA